ncbi:MAG: hypothetical protein LBE11_00155 [Prevotellaceae bacterium]|jgi:hypothetical protein|nr:hypothetical protein [Prevotellaceae bacterium]
MITISLCLSDIPKEKIQQSPNGKKYINLILSERKEAGRFGDTHTLSVSKTKEERESGAKTVYVGRGTQYAPKTELSPQQADDLPAHDLPF